MAAQEHHVAAPLHADGAAVRLLDLRDLALQVAQPLRARLPGLARDHTPICNEKALSTNPFLRPNDDSPGESAIPKSERHLTEQPELTTQRHKEDRQIKPPDRAKIRDSATFQSSISVEREFFINQIHGV